MAKPEQDHFDEDEKRPMVWVTARDPRWPALCEQWKREKSTDKINPKGPFPMASKHVPGSGFGWFFPEHWVDIPAAKPWHGDK